MKCASFALLLTVLATGHAARLGETPASKVVTLLKNMATKIDETGKSEQASYDKYTCWCEDTMSTKAEDITKAKTKLEDLQNNINKNKGGLGSGGATIAQLKKDIAENRDSQKEATEVRTKENSEYEEERVESEQCIGGLEAAIKVLTGAGTGKKGFLETLQQARLLSVVAGVRQSLKAPVIKHKLSNKDLQAMEHFVEKPEDFVNGKKVMGAVQTANNPHGDYAPQSSQIQGILQSMYDTFTGDLEKDNAEEADKQKAFEELMATKKKELNTLESSLEDESKSDADRTKSVADDKAMRTDTREQLASDEEIFTQTKESCAKKAKQWAQRTRSRSQELAGIKEAIKILNSDEAKKTFEESGKTSFLQMSAVVHHKGDHTKHAEAYKRLRSLASSYHSLQLAQIAVIAKTAGHFDDVIAMIDKMIATLREEEASDIAHRDRCENKQNGNKNAKADAEHVKSKAKAEIKRLEGAIKDKEAEIKEIGENMKETKKTMADITKTREEETAAFKKADKADADSIELLAKAQRSLAKFYKFLQVGKPEPETSFDNEGGDYKGSAGEGRGVLSILDMIQQDLEKERKSQGQDEIDAQTDYEKDMSALTDNYRASEKAKSGAEGENADLKSDKQDQTDTKDAAQGDLDDEEKLRKAIKTDCNWIEKDGGNHFKKRKNARKAEVDGLNDAKDFLAGVGTENDLDMP